MPTTKAFLSTKGYDCQHWAYQEGVAEYDAPAALLEAQRILSDTEGTDYEPFYGPFTCGEEGCTSAECYTASALAEALKGFVGEGS